MKILIMLVYLLHIKIKPNHELLTFMIQMKSKYVWTYEQLIQLLMSELLTSQKVYVVKMPFIRNLVNSKTLIFYYLLKMIFLILQPFFFELQAYHILF